MRLPAYEHLSEEQDRAINLDTGGSYLVTGPPGSGKTIVALHRATQFHGDAHLITRSKVLTGYTRSAANELGLSPDSTKTWHQWLYRYWMVRFNGKYPQRKPYEPDWNPILERIFSERERAKESGHVIIDEGQDMSREFFLMLTQIAGDGYTIFADENQRIGDQNSDLNTIRECCAIQPDSVINLRRNYRNTREIAMVASAYYTGLPTGIPEMPDRRGEIPIIRHDSNKDAVLKRIANHARNYPSRVIGVLLPDLKRVRAMTEGLVAAGLDPKLIQHYSSKDKTPVPDFGAVGVKVIAHASAKGLEFDSVFLPWVDQWRYFKEIDAATKMQMYVLASRAREHLEMSYSSSAEPVILTLLDRDSVERRSAN